MNLFIKNPKTLLPDTMLTLAVAGFVFSIMFVTTCIVAAWITNEPDFMKYAAEVAGVIITPTTMAYVTRKYTDNKITNTSVTMSVTPEPEEKE
jgi:hypothetical protein